MTDERYDQVALIHLATTLLHTDSDADEVTMIIDSIRDMRSTLTLTDADKIIAAADNTGQRTWQQIHDALYLPHG